MPSQLTVLLLALLTHPIVVHRSGLPAPQGDDANGFSSNIIRYGLYVNGKLRLHLSHVT